MRYRLCGKTSHVCNCSDAEAWPCISACIEDYLNTLRDNVIYKNAEGAPGDWMDICSASNAMEVTFKSWPTIEACEQWSISCGCGGFLEIKK